MLSIFQLHLQLPFDNCATVAAACNRRRQCVTHCRRLLQRQWNSRRVYVFVQLAYCQFTDDYDKGELWFL